MREPATACAPETGATVPSPLGKTDYAPETIRQLNALTSEFYAREAASFSATRQSPWQGWERAWDIIVAEAPTLAREPLTVLDLGCGNLRFERFLAEKTATPLTVYAFDNCPALAEATQKEIARAARPNATENKPHPVPAPSVRFEELDLIEALLGDTLSQLLPKNSCNLAVAFGLMHHLPAFWLRTRTLEGLLGSLQPGGFALASFWQFLDDERLAAKADAATAEGRARHRLPPFAPNDRLLGWQHAEGVYRFCHHTPDEEIDALLNAVALPFREVARFSADGRNGALNRYLVLQRA